MLQHVSFVCYGLALACMVGWTVCYTSQAWQDSLILPVAKAAPMLLLSVNALSRLTVGFDATVFLLGIAFLFHGAGDFLLAETCSLCFTAVSGGGGGGCGATYTHRGTTTHDTGHGQLPRRTRAQYYCLSLSCRGRLLSDPGVRARGVGLVGILSRCRSTTLLPLFSPTNNTLTAPRIACAVASLRASAPPPYTTGAGGGRRPLALCLAVAPFSPFSLQLGPAPPVPSSTRLL